MADKTINDLTAATSLNAGDLFEIENTGNNSRKVTAAVLATYASSRLHSDFTSAGTPASNVETDLASYTLPAGTLSDDGMGIRVTAWGTLTATTRNRAVAVYFGATKNPTFGSASSAVVQWRSDVTILRSGATTQTGSARSAMGQAGAADDLLYRTRQFAAAETMSGAIVIRVTGEVTGAAVANDITCTGFLVEIIR